MSRRIGKVNKLLKQEISNLILKELDFSREIIITVTKVEIPSDLEWAKIWVSILPFSRAEMVLGVLNSKKYNIQKLLNQKLRMRIIPKIKFKLDTSEEKVSRVERLLKNNVRDY